MTLKYKIMRRLTSLISALEFGEEFLFGFRLILAGFHHFVTDFAGAEKELKSLSPSSQRMLRSRAIKSSTKRWISSRIVPLLFSRISRHMVGSEPAIRVKSRKPEAEYLMISFCS